MLFDLEAAPDENEHARQRDLAVQLRARADHVERPLHVREGADAGAERGINPSSIVLSAASISGE
jgi:hypothetical protein